VKETSHKRSHGKDVAQLRWLDRYLGHLMLSQVTQEVIEKIGERKASEASPSTSNRTLALIRSIFRRAKNEWEWLDRIPFVRLYREPKQRIRFLTPDEARRLLTELPEHLREMAQFALMTGLRQRNVSYLRWNQVDMSRRVAWIHPDETKAGRAIGVPLNESAMEVLRRRLGKHRLFVFTYKGEPVDRCSTRAWKLALGRAGIERAFRWHDLRHTWASWHVQNGTPLQELMELGSWASYDMVLRYAHLAADHLQGAANRIDDTFLTHKQKPQLVRLV
jgi:integrase